MDFAYYILTPFTWLLQLFNSLTGGYGFALILFAVVVKLILFPFSLKSKRSMIQMNMLSGKMQQIQRKYANDKERQNLEIQKLYEKEKVNPMRTPPPTSLKTTATTSCSWPPSSTPTTWPWSRRRWAVPGTSSPSTSASWAWTCPRCPS